MISMRAFVHLYAHISSVLNPLSCTNHSIYFCVNWIGRWKNTTFLGENFCMRSIWLGKAKIFPSSESRTVHFCPYVVRQREFGRSVRSFVRYHPVDLRVNSVHTNSHSISNRCCHHSTVYVMLVYDQHFVN